MKLNREKYLYISLFCITSAVHFNLSAINKGGKIELHQGESWQLNFNNNFEGGQLHNVIRRRRQQDIQPSSYMKCIPNAMREENNKLNITTSYSVKQVASLEDINPKHAVVFKINMN